MAAIYWELTMCQAFDGQYLTESAQLYEDTLYPFVTGTQRG